MSRKLTISALLAACCVGAALLPGAAEAALSEPQKLFRQKLLDDSKVSKTVKAKLRSGAFVDRGIQFADLTGEGRADAIVTVNSGGSAGRIALYVFSSGSSGGELVLVYRNEGLYRVRTRLDQAPTAPGQPADQDRPGTLFFRVPLYDIGDDVCCPARARETQLGWDADEGRFRVIKRTIVPRKPERSQFCTEGDAVCTATRRKERVVLLDLRARGLRGEYRLCVTDPRDATACKNFDLERSKDDDELFVSTVRWSKEFKSAGRGLYDVCWRQSLKSSKCIGPRLQFRIGD